MSNETRSLIIRRLREHLDEIESFTRGLTEQQLRERPWPDKRSLADIVQHLARTQDLYIDHVATMLTERNPAVEQDIHEAPHPDDDIAGLSIILRSYIEQRKTLVALLISLEDRQWKMEGRHPHIKNYTVEKSMEMLMRHEESHLYEMFRTFFGVEEE